MEPKPTGFNEVVKDVQESGLCTGCGACVNICPYFDSHKGKTVWFFKCDRPSGRCYTYCPRTPTDFDILREKLFDPKDLTPEIGAFKGLFITRATDEAIRKSAQHGGTVTALMQLAISESLIDTAILADDLGLQVPEAKTIDDPNDVSSMGRSKFVTPPMIGKFNEAIRGSAQSIGSVLLPCQAQALAKMRVNPESGEEELIDKMKLVIGLFCGWAFDWDKLRVLLEKTFGDAAILKLDIPPSMHERMDVTTEAGTTSIPIEEVQNCIAEGCDYCFDMTCEFTDISVGGARSPEGWEVDKGWNQVIVRTEQGQTLLEMARSKDVLEFKDVPDENIDKLKKASMNKKTYCLKKLIEKSGDEKDLIYLNDNDSIVRKIQQNGG